MLVAAPEAAAQRATPSGVTDARHSLGLWLAPRSRQFARETPLHARDSTNGEHGHEGIIVLGTFVGAAVGLEIGGRLAPHENCSGCGVMGSLVDRDIERGALVGAIVWGAFTWWLFSRD
jgi:hypothetical protein